MEIIILALALIVSCATLAVTWLTARRQLRAYVNVSDIEIETVTHPVVVKFLNLGQTPAYRRHAQSRLKVFDRGAEDFELPKLPIESEVTLGAGMELGIGATWPALNDEQVEAVKAGKLTMFLFGRVRYADIYGHNHQTNFRFQLASPDGNWKHGGFKACESGNEATWPKPPQPAPPNPPRCVRARRSPSCPCPAPESLPPG